MDLYILRHGEADPRSPKTPDAGRKLTPKGIKEVRRVIKCAQSAGIAPSIILSSSLVRAQETAKVAAKRFTKHAKVEIRETDALLPDAKPELLWAEIDKLGPVDQVMVVGHNPHVTRFAAYVLGAGNSPINIDIKKGALMRITVTSPVPTTSKSGKPAASGGILQWLLTPQLARR